MSSVRVLLLLAFGALVGCGGRTDLYAYQLISAPPSVPPGLPEVYLRGTTPPAMPFVEVAVLQARGNESFPDTVAALQNAAAKLGAEALVDVRGEIGTYETSVLATAIRWQTQPPVPAAQPRFERPQ